MIKLGLPFWLDGPELAKLKAQGIGYRILFLDAADEKLVARYKSSRRRHPLCADGASIAQGIDRERDLLFEVREAADSRAASRMRAGATAPSRNPASGARRLRTASMKAASSGLVFAA